MQESGLAMDIRKWLAETESPDAPEQLGVENLLLLKQADTTLDARRRRKRSSSDSSLLKAPSPQPRRQNGRTTKREHRRVQETTAEAQSVTSRSTSSELTDQTTASRRYARKPRRKTCPDKYEAGSKDIQGQDESQRQGRKVETRKSKRKSKRRKDDRTHLGIERNFQARNVSKDRLTLKPLKKMGLFSKGKASTSTQSRGLPDLVFSDTKFLQNNHDSTAQLPDTKRKRKKDNARSREDDISAFFTSVRPALAEADGNISAKGKRTTTCTPATKPSRRNRARGPSAVHDGVVPTVESEGKASYLGFGSREPRHERASYFSWSESIRAPSATSRRRRSASSLHRTHVQPSTLDSAEAAQDVCAPVRQRAPSLVVHEPATASLRPTRRSSVVPMPSGLSRSQSLPQPSSSPRKSNLVVRATHPQTSEGVTSPSSLPPVFRAQVGTAHEENVTNMASRSRQSIRTSHAGDNAAFTHAQDALDVAGDVLSLERPRWLTGQLEVVQHYGNTSQGGRGLASRRNLDNGIAFIPGDRRQAHEPRCGSYETSRQTPPVRFLAAETKSSALPNFSGPNIYVQQENRQHLPLDERAFEEDFDDLAASEYIGQDYIGDPRLWKQEVAAGWPEEPSLYETMENLDGDAAQLGYVADGIEPVQGSGHTSIVTPGFWRPNRLY